MVPDDGTLSFVRLLLEAHMSFTQVFHQHKHLLIGDSVFHFEVTQHIVFNGSFEYLCRYRRTFSGLPGLLLQLLPTLKI